MCEDSGGFFSWGNVQKVACLPSASPKLLAASSFSFQTVFFRPSSTSAVTPSSLTSSLALREERQIQSSDGRNIPPSHLRLVHVDLAGRVRAAAVRASGTTASTLASARRAVLQ